MIRRPTRLRLAGAVLAALFLGVAVAASCSGAPGREADELQHLTRAWFHPSAGSEAPAPDDPAWRPVPLPDYWGLARRARTLDGWYRLAFTAQPRGPWAASIDGDWKGLQIALNGEPQLAAHAQVASLVPTEPSLLLILSANELQAGANELVIRFETEPWRIGLLGDVVVGPMAAVRAHRDQRRFLHLTLPTSFAWFALACGAIVALLGRWEASGGASWFAAATMAWCLPLVDPLRSLVGHGEGFASSVLLHAFPPLFAIGFHRTLQIRRPRLERALLGTIAGGALLRLLAPPLLVPPVDWLWWMVDIAIAAYVLRLALRARRRRAIPRATGLLVAAGVAIAAGLHDVASLFAGQPLLGAALSPFAPALLGLTTAATLVATLGERLATAQRLNAELEERVEQKRRALAESYARMADLERARTIAAERERLMRDMHDGTGGQIVSALAMVEGGRFEPEAVAEVLRDALADLRFSIDSLDPSEPDLASLLGAARARLEPRLEARGMRFDWQVQDVGRPAGFGPGPALQVLRIFQEAIVNALRHAGAKVLTVRTGEERDATGAWACIEVADDGRGFASGAAGEAERAGGGRGLGNMQRRAAAIGGTLAITSGPAGTRLRLRLPL